MIGMGRNPNDRGSAFRRIGGGVSFKWGVHLGSRRGACGEGGGLLFCKEYSHQTIKMYDLHHSFGTSKTRPPSGGKNGNIGGGNRLVIYAQCLDFLGCSKKHTNLGRNKMDNVRLDSLHGFEISTLEFQPARILLPGI